MRAEKAVEALRRALRVEDQAAFDALLGFARVFADAGSMVGRTDRLGIIG